MINHTVVTIMKPINDINFEELYYAVMQLRDILIKYNIPLEKTCISFSSNDKIGYTNIHVAYVEG